MVASWFVWHAPWWNSFFWPSSCCCWLWPCFPVVSISSRPVMEQGHPQGLSMIHHALPLLLHHHLLRLCRLEDSPITPNSNNNSTAASLTEEEQSRHLQQLYTLLPWRLPQRQQQRQQKRQQQRHHQLNNNVSNNDDVNHHQSKYCIIYDKPPPSYNTFWHDPLYGPRFINPSYVNMPIMSPPTKTKKTLLLLLLVLLLITTNWPNPSLAKIRGKTNKRDENI